MNRVSKLLCCIALLAATGLAGCEEELIQSALGTDEPLSLRDNDLPNCSRVLNCCQRLSSGSYADVLPASVSEACGSSIGVAADAAISQYQSARDGITGQTGLTDEDRASLLSDLRGEWQGRAEPGCRCFVEGTVGVVPDLALPADCESIDSTGTLGADQTCNDATGALLEVPSLDD